MLPAIPATCRSMAVLAGAGTQGGGSKMVHPGERTRWVRPGRRAVLPGLVALGAAAALTVGSLPAVAQDDEAALRAELLQIPGVGKGSPTDADYQKVGALTLGPTKANMAQGECAGVTLKFVGLNNQNY